MARRMVVCMFYMVFGVWFLWATFHTGKPPVDPAQAYALLLAAIAVLLGMIVAGLEILMATIDNR